MLIFLLVVVFVLLIIVGFGVRSYIISRQLNKNYVKEIQLKEQYIIKYCKRNQYYTWIINYLKKNDCDVSGCCKEAVYDMVIEFPELTVVQGLVLEEDGKTTHYWLIDPYGDIIDPTACQFFGEIKYLPLFYGLERISNGKIDVLIASDAIPESIKTKLLQKD